MKSTVSVILTDHQSTLMLHAETLVDTTPMVDAITTPATVSVGIIQLMANAIVNLHSILHQHVKILEDIMITSAARATTTHSTALGSSLMDVIAISIVPITAK